MRGRKAICQVLDCSWPKAKKELKRLNLFRHDGGGIPILIVSEYLEVSKKGSDEEPFGVIYVLKVNDCFKIGKAKDFIRRYSIYVTHNPYPIEIICKQKVNNYHAVEERLLKKFKSKKIKNEWFKLSDTDISEIKNILGIK